MWFFKGVWCFRLVPSAEWRQQGMVAYTRASIEHYLKTKNANFEYLNNCRHKILSMPHYQSDYMKEMLTKSQALDNRFTSVALRQIRCNLNPEVHYQPFLSIVCNMVKRYDLDYEGAVGVLLALYMAPSSAFFTCIAATILMAVCEPQLNFNAGFALQHTIASMAPHVKMGDGGVKNRYPGSTTTTRNCTLANGRTYCLVCVGFSIRPRISMVLLLTIIVIVIYCPI